jgi:glucose/arabinose dehydrogenase
MRFSKGKVAVLLIALVVFGFQPLLQAQTPATPAPAAAPTPAQAPFPKVRLVPAYPHLIFERAVAMVEPPDGSGRFFVVEQDGKILWFPKENRDVGSTQVFLDIQDKVSREHNEEGLLSLAFDPGYRENGYFYIVHSIKKPLANVLVRYKVSGDDPNKADPSSGKILLTIEKPYGNHNGSTLLFGKEGYLYMSVGDGGSAGDPHGHGQNLDSLLGKILRIDVHGMASDKPYGIPADNPFANRDEAKPEIWAYGLRNVWRMSFDRVLAELWAGDVGQNKFEEVNLIVKGGNYGWNLREGAHPFGKGGKKPSKNKSKKEDQPQAVERTDPVAEYGRDLGASVTGGYVYRGRRLRELWGAYVFADFVTGTVFALRHHAGKVLAKGILTKQPQNISSFAEDQDGELYLLGFIGEKIYEMEIVPPGDGQQARSDR